MPRWLWFVLIPVGILLLPVILGLVALILVILITAPVWGRVDAWLSRSKLSSSVTTTLHKSELDPSTLIISVHGILADGESFNAPIMDTLLKHGDVMTLSYKGGQFEERAVVNTIAEIMQQDAQHTQFVLAGHSMGGRLALDVKNRLSELGEDSVLANTGYIIVDSPSGSRDMLLGGSLAAPALRFVPFGHASNRCFQWLMDNMSGKPEDKNIEEGLDNEAIKRTAAENLKGHKLTDWRNMLVYMATAPKLRPMSFYGIDRIVYLRCDRVVTVNQPQAANTWQQACGEDLQAIPVDSVHCDYAARPKTWSLAFDQAITAVKIAA